MPNHITTKITSPDAGAIEALIKLLKSADREVDFNNVIPMPSCINVNGVSFGVEALAKITLGLVDFKELPVKDPVDAFDRKDYFALARDLERQNAIKTLTEGKMVKDLDEKDFEAFVNMLKSYRECQCLSWYDWSIQNWGTKWNAYEAVIEDGVSIMFQTAWSFPAPVAEAICKLLPEYTFEFKWADEDVGSNTGHITAKGEEFSGGSFENGSDDAYQTVIELGVCDETELRKVNGKWVYGSDED